MEGTNEEWKASWDDGRCLSTIAAFANTPGGGTMIIGIDDKTGKPIGVRNSRKLKEEIPNTVRNKLGFFP
ncbi:MAG: ATP-binding protein [Candidatus Methanoplasma sp.]|jgi:ATP-dependent DNA helicase RecG|nr:ATP-binding protein [Candidatus Methanoplasma sp.]